MSIRLLWVFRARFGGFVHGFVVIVIHGRPMFYVILYMAMFGGASGERADVCIELAGYRTDYYIRLAIIYICYGAIWAIAADAH